jgi:cold shock protein
VKVRKPSGKGQYDDQSTLNGRRRRIAAIAIVICGEHLQGRRESWLRQRVRVFYDVQLGRRLGDQVADQNNITPDRHLGDRNGARHREVVQSDQGLWIIQPQAGGKDVFVHISAVERAGLSTLNEGQHIEYEIEENRGKTSAVNLKVK